MKILKESSLPNKLEAGTKFTNVDGGEFYINRVYVDIDYMPRPETYLEFQWKFQRKHGNQTQSLDSFIKTYLKG